MLPASWPVVSEVMFNSVLSYFCWQRKRKWVNSIQFGLKLLNSCWCFVRHCRTYLCCFCFTKQFFRLYSSVTFCWCLEHICKNTLPDWWIRVNVYVLYSLLSNVNRHSDHWTACVSCDLLFQNHFTVFWWLSVLFLAGWRQDTRQYLDYLEGDFEVFRPQGRHFAPIGRNLAWRRPTLPHWSGVGPRKQSFKQLRKINATRGISPTPRDVYVIFSSFVGSFMIS